MIYPEILAQENVPSVIIDTTFEHVTTSKYGPGRISPYYMVHIWHDLSVASYLLHKMI